MNLIPEWRDAWRFWSARFMAACAALPAVWISLPADLRAVVPNEWLVPIMAVMALAGLIARVVPQPKARAKIAARKAGGS